MPFAKKKPATAAKSSTAKSSASPAAAASSKKCCGDTGKASSMISERAYYIWESMGKPDGKDMEIWLQAEKDVKKACKK